MIATKVAVIFLQLGKTLRRKYRRCWRYDVYETRTNLFTTRQLQGMNFAGESRRGRGADVARIDDVSREYTWSAG